MTCCDKETIKAVTLNPITLWATPSKSKSLPQWKWGDACGDAFWEHVCMSKTKSQSSTTWCFHQQQEHQQFQMQPCAVEETRVRKNNLTISHSPTVSVRNPSALSCKRRLCPKKPIEATNHAWWLAAVHWNTRENIQKTQQKLYTKLGNLPSTKLYFVRISHIFSCLIHLGQFNGSVVPEGWLLSSDSVRVVSTVPSGFLTYMQLGLVKNPF